MTEVPEQFKRPDDIEQQEGEGLRESMVRHFEEQFRGQSLEARPPKRVQVGDQQVTLSGDVPNWTEEIRREANFDLDPSRPHLANYDKLKPTAQGWMERIAGFPESPTGEWTNEKLGPLIRAAQEKPILSALITPVTWAANGLQKLATTAERAAGYAYQARFDPNLRSAKSLGYLLAPKNQKALADPQRWASDFQEGIITEEQARVGSAWYAGSFFFEATPVRDLPGIKETGKMFTAFLEPAVYQDFVAMLRHLLEGGNLETYEDIRDPERKRILDSLGFDQSDVEQDTARSVEAYRAFMKGEGYGNQPGLAAMVDFRLAVLNGDDPQDSYEQWLASRGALAFTDQVVDLAGQVILDPANILIPTGVHLVEKAHTIRQVTLFGRVAPKLATRLDDAATLLGKIDDVPGIAGHADEFLKGAALVADEADEATVMGRHLADAVKALDEVAEATGVNEVKQAAKAIRQAIESGGSVEDVRAALGQADEILSKFDDFKRMTPIERMVFSLSGGDPFLKPEGGFQGWTRGRWNPIALSPDAKAHSFIDTMWNNLSRMLAGAGDDVERMVEIYKRAASGAFTTEFGHMFVSPIGKYVQNTLSGASSKVDELFTVWQQTKSQRRIAQNIADLTGSNIVQVVNRMQGGADEVQALLDEIVDAAYAGDGILAELFQNLHKQGGLTQDVLAKSGAALKTLKDGRYVPYTPDLFRALMLKEMADVAADFGKLHFGVREANALEKAVQYVKAAESLMLLGLNPFYPIQNFFNNEITMMARGVHGLMLPRSLTSKLPGVRRWVSTIEDVWDSFGVSPARLYEGFGVQGADIIEEIATNTGAAERTALASGREVLRTARWGKPSGVGGWFLDKVRAGRDMRQMASSMESFASQRATTTGMLKGWNQLWRRGVGYDDMNKFRPGLRDKLARISPELADEWDSAIRSARSVDDLQDLMRAKNIKLNPEELARRAARNLGLDADEIVDIIGPEIKETVRRAVAELGADASAEDINRAFGQIDDFVQGHLDEVLESQYPQMIEEFAAKVESERAPAIVDLYGRASDHVTARWFRHEQKLMQNIGDIITIEDDALRSAAWEGLLTELGEDWNRTWRFHENITKGISKGLKNAGVSGADEYLDSFKGLRNSTEEFFNTRNKLWKEYFQKSSGLSRAEKSRMAEAVYSQLDDEYLTLIDKTVDSWKAMDDFFVGLFPEGNQLQQQAAMEWRNMVRRVRRFDMEDVASFRADVVRGLNPQEAAPLWEQKWQERLLRQTQIKQLEDYGRLAMNGDEQALNFFRVMREQRLAGYGPLADVMLAQTPEQAINAFANALSDAVDIRIVPANTFSRPEDIMAKTRWGELINNPDQPLRVDISQALLDLYETDPAGAMRMTRDTIMEEFVHLWQVQEESIPQVARFLGVDLADDPARVVGQLLLDDDNRRAVEKMAEAIRDLFMDPVKLMDDPELYVLTRELVENNDELMRMGEVMQNMPGPRILAAGPSPAQEVLGISLESNAIELLTKSGASIRVDDQRNVVRSAVRMRLFKFDPEVPQSKLQAMIDAILDDLQRGRRAFPSAEQQDFDALTEALEKLSRSLDDEVTLGKLFGGDVVVETPERTFSRLFKQPPAKPQPGIPDFEKVVGRGNYFGTGVSELWFDRGSDIVKEMGKEAVKVINEPPARFGQLPSNVQRDLRAYLSRVQGQQSDTVLASMRVAEGMRDAALLNYNRRYNFDNWASNIFPFHFWFTHSAWRWAIHSIDRPWMLASYAKASNFLHSATSEERGFPSRLRGNLKFKMPFAPPEMGETWIDPSRAFGLPFGTFEYPYERMLSSQGSIERDAQNKLQELLQNGQIDRNEYEQALANQSGPIWQRALGLARQDSANQRFGLLDFMNATTSPHLPIQIALNIARGTPEELTPLPPTRFAKNVLDFVSSERHLQGIAEQLGIDAGTYDSIWGNIREAVGLPAFDQWDDYRIERELSNMEAQGLIPVGSAVQAMVEGEQSEDWIEARDRVARIESAEWGYRMLGIPVASYPDGERRQRELGELFFEAMNMRENGDPTALRDFFDEYPEFQARLALWDEPEERHRQFLVDNLWDWYNNAPKVHREEAEAHLGELWQSAFINKSTRSTDNIPNETLAAWLKILTGETVGQVSWDSELYPIEFTDPQEAQRAQVFYDTRDSHFNYSERVWPLWEDYFKLEEGSAARRQYWDENPILEDYVEWRREFMLRNPDIMHLIEDDPDRQPKFDSIQALEQAQAAAPSLSWTEWRVTVGRAAADLVLDWYAEERVLSEAVIDRLDNVAGEMGITRSHILTDMFRAAEAEGLLQTPQVVP